MDVERVCADRVMADIGVRCTLDVPTERPDEFVQFSLATTGGDRYVKRPRVLATSWAKTRRRAKEIAEAV